jgi:hypothetical protein
VSALLTTEPLTEPQTISSRNRARALDRLALVVTMLCTVAVCAPFFRYVQWFGDEGIVLNAADKILRGDRLYGDFFEFVPPGSFLIGTAWMQLIGSSFASIRVLAIGVIVAIAGLTYVASRVACRNPILAALLVVTWVVQSQGVWTIVSHHWFATAASMASAGALLSALASLEDSAVALRVSVRGTRRDGAAAWLLAGLFAGVAAMMTPTQGAVLCLAALGLAATCPDRRRAMLSVIGGTAVFPLASLAYLGVTGSIAAALYDTIVFPLRHYSAIEIVSFGAFAAPHQLPAVVFLQITFLLTGLAAMRDRQALRREPVFRGALALTVVAVPSMFPRPDVTHINFVLPLACPMFALATQHLLRRLERPTRRAVVVGLIALGVVIIGSAAYTQIVPIAASPLRPVSTARGVFLGPPSPWIEAVAALVSRVERTPTTDRFFFYPYSPMLPYLTAREHVAPLAVMLPGHTTIEQYRDVCLRVIRDARWIVIDRSWTDPLFLQMVYPSMRVFDPPEMREFDGAMRAVFDEVVHASAIYELRRRSRPVPDTTCGRI